MLLHITPKLFSPFRNVELIDLEIAQLGLRLTTANDLVTRRPYPNKRYAVGCRKLGRKAIDGILIETSATVDEFRYVARWAVEAETVVTHRVDYKVLDHDFDTASDSMMLWYACCAELGGWSDRWPAWAKDAAPIYSAPMMEVVPPVPSRQPSTEDVMDELTGWITNRRQTFAMPTIERERLLNTKVRERMPSPASVFRCVQGS